MKIKLFSLVLLLVVASCSTPKYTYNFDHYNYQSGKKSATLPVLMASDQFIDLYEAGPVAPVEPMLLADEVSLKLSNLSKGERKDFKKEIKKVLKNRVKALKDPDHGSSVTATKALDKDLKLGAIFGAVGIVGLILGSAADFFFIIGGIALIIGVVFFVKWLVRQ